MRCVGGKEAFELLVLMLYTFSCSTQLSMKLQLFINTKMLKNIDIFAFKLSDVVFIMLINVKIPTIVGISTFISMINFMLS